MSCFIVVVVLPPVCLMNFVRKKYENQLRCEDRESEEIKEKGHPNILMKWCTGMELCVQV